MTPAITLRLNRERNKGPKVREPVIAIKMNLTPVCYQTPKMKLRIKFFPSPKIIPSALV